MRKYRQTLKVADLAQNNGQLSWLPKNPRQWKQADIDRTAKSIQEDEDFLEDRPLLVVSDGDKGWVAFAGNLRLTASRKVGLKEVPCVVYEVTEEEEDHLTIKRRAMKDNGSFGAWDFDLLANEWDDLPLVDWGIPAWETDEEEKQKATEQLSSMVYDTPYFEPEENPNIILEDCVNLDKFNAKVTALDEYDLTDEQKKVLMLFAYRFIKIDFEKVATYYAFNATDEEKKAMERLRLVLVDAGSIRGFIDDDMIRIASLTDRQIQEME